MNQNIIELAITLLVEQFIYQTLICCIIYSLIKHLKFYKLSVIIKFLIVFIFTFYFATILKFIACFLHAI